MADYQFQKSSLQLYARKSADGEGMQTLEEHSRNVADLAGKFASSFDVPSLGRLIGLVHDWGKGLRQWQEYLLQGGPPVRHAVASARAVDSFFNSEKDKCSPLLSMIIGMVVWGHHSGLRDCISLDGKHCYYSDLAAEVQFPPDEIIGLLDETQKKELEDLYQESLQELRKVSRAINHSSFLCAGKGNDENKLPEEQAKSFCVQLGIFMKMLLSSLVDADRLDAASWEDGIPCFESAPDWEMMGKKLDDYLKGKDSLSKIGRIRASVSESCFQAAKCPGGVYSLLVPTGGGKTLSSLRFAIEHARRNGLKHIFYIIPYTTILDQTSEVVESVLGREVVLEHYSTAAREAGKTAENDERTGWSWERWDRPVILTTQVQFFNAFFSGDNSDVRRLHQLCSSVVIFDEAQTVPAKLLSLFSLCVSFLSYCGHSTVMLCSATVPTYAKLKYRLQPEPVLSGSRQLFSEMERTEIVDAREKITKDAIPDFVLERPGSVLVILNTRAAVCDLFLKLRRKTRDRKIYHLSTSMYPKHRKQIVEEIREDLAESRNIIVVSTNLIEAGIDVSFSCVVRSLAGLDSVAQAAGRCNRNGEYEGKREVFLIDYKEKGIDKIGNLKDAQESTRRVLDEKEKYPSLLSPEPMDCYFKHFFNDISTPTNGKDKTTYPFSAKGRRLDMVDVLGPNTEAFRTAIKQEGKKREKMPFGAAFASAAEHFSVIEKKSKDVVVSCKDSEKLLEKLKNSHDGLSRYDSLRVLQQYTVQLFDDQISQLEQRGALEKWEDGSGMQVLLLKGKFYNEEMGVDFTCPD